MGKFVSKIAIKTKFDGDEVTLTARPMDRATAMKLRSVAPRITGKDADGKPTPANEAEERSLEDASMEVLNAFIMHLEEVSGLRDAAGADVPLEAVKRDAYFVGLLMSSAQEWSERSVPGN